MRNFTQSGQVTNGQNLKKTVPIDNMFSIESLKKLAGPDELKTSADTQVNNTAKFTVPVNLNLGDKVYSLEAEAKLTLKINIDLSAILDAQKIENKETRLNKIRQLIHMDTSHCELNFL